MIVAGENRSTPTKETCRECGDTFVICVMHSFSLLAQVSNYLLPPNRKADTECMNILRQIYTKKKTCIDFEYLLPQTLSRPYTDTHRHAAVTFRQVRHKSNFAADGIGYRLTYGQVFMYIQGIPAEIQTPAV